jgi:hypothetical protein
MRSRDQIVVSLNLVATPKGNPMTTLTVGPGQQFATCSAAVAAAVTGDRIEVVAGLYPNDFSTINGKKITIAGVGGMAHFHATIPIPNDRGIFTAGDDITFDHLELSGATGASANDAGIRHTGGNLTVTNCNIHDNQNGILGNAIPGAEVLIDHSEFAHDGISGGHTHGIYIGQIAKLTVTNSYFHEQNIGHHIKSRAAVNIIKGNRLDDLNGTTSYNADFSNGGDCTMDGNFIQQGPNTGNFIMVAFASEGSLLPGSALKMNNNVFLNQRANSAWGVFSFDATVVAQLTGNSFFGLTSAQIVGGPGTNNHTGDIFLGAAPAIDQSSPIQGAGTPIPVPTPTPVPVDLAALTAAVAALQGDVTIIKGDTATLKAGVAAIQKALAALTVPPAAKPPPTTTPPPTGRG